MSKILSILAGITVIVLLMVLGGAIISLADARDPIDSETRASVGTAFTYQGHLADGPTPASGRYDFAFALYDDPDTGSQVGPTVAEVITVTGGLFAVELDFGSVFDGTALWLEIGVRPDGDADPHTLLLPRQRLTAAPFATYASSAPWSGLSGVPAGFADGVDDDTLYQAGTGLDLADTTMSITLTYQLPQGCDPDQFVRWTGASWACTEAGTGIVGWSLSGNSGTTPGTDFLGTTDDAALQLHVNGSRALRLEPAATSPNIVGGYEFNDVGVGVSGATVSGGGRELAINSVSAGFGTVGGGASNSATGYGATVGGGEGNVASDNYATTGGGLGNSAGGATSTVGGGSNNAAAWDHATVSGGSGNWTDAALAAVGGGGSNVISGTYGTVAGGLQNQAGGTGAAIGGGESNAASGDHAAVGGGYYNAVSASYGTIAGGGPSELQNPTTTNNQVHDDYGTIGGGGGNIAGHDDDDPASQPYSTVAGGLANAASGSYAVASGGNGNTAGGYASAIGGGLSNSAENNYTTVAGGTGNSASSNYATIGGGYGHNVTGLYGTIPGGRQNAVAGNFGFAAGLQAHADHDGAFVWSGSPDVFASTGPGQFLIDASGGVGIGTDSPTQMLTVQGSAALLSSDPVPVSVVYSTSRTLDAPSAVHAAGDYLYVTSYSTNTLSIWNVSNPEQVVPVGYSTSHLNGPSDLFVSGQRAYVASEGNNRLVVFDLSNPSAPDSLGSTDEGLANPVALHVAGKYAYVASNGPGAGDGLAVFDVSDPTQIRLLDFTNTNLLGTTDVFVAGSHAYVTSAGNDTLAVFDISDPRPGRIRALGTATGPLDGPQALFVSGPYAYVVADGSDNLTIFDISDPDHIVDVGSTSTNLVDPVDLLVSGNLAYVVSSGNDRLAVFDVSDPANIVDLGSAQTGIKPVSLFMAGKQIYVANETGDSVGIYEVTHLEAPTLQTGSLQTAYLDVTGNGAINNDLAIYGGLQVGASGARIGGALSVTGPDDSQILGALSVGGAGALISDTVLLTRTQWMTAPTHALDVIGEGRFRVNDYTNLVLRSANAGTDEDAYIDLIRSDQTTVLTPSARIEFNIAEPFTHTTSIHFHTQGPDDPTTVSRLQISEEGHLLPEREGFYTLGDESFPWLSVYTLGVVNTSDGRYKENVNPLPYGLDEVTALRPVSFSWTNGQDDELHYGLIAQEVREVLPEIVTGDEGVDATLGLNYSELVPVLVQAVQEQQAEIEAQADQIADLEARLEALEEGQRSRSSLPGGLNLLATLGLGGLVLGMVSIAGVRRMGGRS